MASSVTTPLPTQELPKDAPPESTAIENPDPAPQENELKLEPRAPCVDYSDYSECGRNSCCGLPLVDGFFSRSMLSQHDPVQVALWDGIEGNKALCWLANPYGFTEETVFHLLKDALAAILPAGSKFILSSPVPSPLAKRARPVTFLVWNLTAQESSLLTDREVWSIRSPRALAFFAEEYDGSPSPFVFTATGFSSGNVFGHDGIEMLFRETVRWHPAIREFVSCFHDALPDDDHASPDYLLASCRVEPFTIKDRETNEDIELWNFSMESPTKHHALHAAWRRLVASIPLISLSYGSARAVDTALLCSMCLATSHTTELCPWPKMRGWAGPSIRDVAASIALPEERSERHIACSGEPVLYYEGDLARDRSEF